jgi:hypothetical protein
MSLEILPLAITMMAGPQIMSAIVLVTSDDAVKKSVAFVMGVLLATAIGVAALTGIASLLGDDLGDSSDSGSAGQIIQYALVALLFASAIRNYVNRETVEPPTWLGKLQEAGTNQAFRTGLLVVLFMPSDLIVMATVATNLQTSGESLSAAIPFVVATTLIAALPVLGYLIFHRRAVVAMPKLRDWMRTNAWLVNIIVCAVFIVLIL